MKAGILQQLIKMAGMVFCSALLGTALLVLVFCIPTGRIRDHVASSVDSVLRNDDAVPDNAYLQYVFQNKEGYTDSIMVQYAFEKIPGKNAFEHAMWAYHYDLEEGIWAAEESLRAVLDGADTSRMHLREYSRYWHGYLVYLKPLLLVFSWSGLVVFGIVLQILMLAALIIAAIRHCHPEVAAVVAAGFAFMKPSLVMVSVDMSVCWIITLAALLFLLCRGDWLERHGAFPFFFLAVGILTSYFDFLTYPVVTCAYPLCVYFLMHEEDRVLEGLKRLTGYCASWGIGYAGMWSMKWLIADVTLHTGTIKDALWNVIGRTEAIGGRPRFNGGFYVIGLNLQEYDKMIYPIAASVLALLALVFLVWACIKTSVKETLRGAAPYVVSFFIPFAWIIAVQHHSALHARFTFRILSIAVLAACCIGAHGLRRLAKSG